VELLELMRQENARAFQDVGQKLESQASALSTMQVSAVRIKGEVGSLNSAVKKLQASTSELRPNHLVKRAVGFINDMEATLYKEDARLVTCNFKGKLRIMQGQGRLGGSFAGMWRWFPAFIKTQRYSWGCLPNGGRLDI
jgi:hypothetical protein